MDILRVRSQKICKECARCSDLDTCIAKKKCKCKSKGGGGVSTHEFMSSIFFIALVSIVDIFATNAPFMQANEDA